GVDLARTVFQYAAIEDKRCLPDRLQFLDALLRDPLLPRDVRQSEPLYVETLLLRRLVDLAGAESDKTKGGGPAWPETAARLALQAAWHGERAAACTSGLWEPRALPWVQQRLNEAAQERHDAEVILFAPGYASLEEAQKRFESA